MSDPVPAILEGEARGETARIFADIRETLGSPVVNLIWRHLATVDGGLEWAWTAARPIYAGRQAQAAAARLYARLDPPLPCPLPPGALAAVGVSAADLPRLRAVADGYNRGNGPNLVALTALLVDPAGTAPADPVPAASAPAPLPRLLSEPDVTPETWALVKAINLLGARPDEPILATMYRHLANWPGFLALMHASWAPLAADGRFEAAIARARSLSKEEATGLANLRADAGPAPEAARAALVEFTDHVISRMVPVGVALARWLPSFAAAKGAAPQDE
ncbi:hypothetical protein [Thalassobaculum sp.]|uniref:hypothetical protein n=1 Tax=Thalassobaculum sp. TaxID=2022740 RepID=UPI0032F0232C